MKANQRRQLILESLKQSSQPISASQLASQFEVSRQVIVGDVALLRAFMEMMSLSAELEHAARVAAAKRVTAPAMIFLVFILKMSPFFINFLIIS